MAIAYDSSSTGTANPGTSVTFPQTCTGSNLLLIVGIATNDTTDKVTGVTYNGVAMTLLSAYQAATTNFYGFTYYLIAPDTGTHDIVASRSDSGVLAVMGASYTGVSQTGFPDSQATGSDATGDYTATTTVVSSNCWLWANTRSNAAALSSDATTRQTIFGGYGMIVDSNGPVGTGSQSINFTASPGGETNWNAVSFSPAAASGPANVKTINGLALASVKTVNGLAIASVKTVNGLA